MWGGWIWVNVDWFDFVCLILGFGVRWVGLPWFDCGFWFGWVCRFGFPVDLTLMWVGII